MSINDGGPAYPVIPPVDSTGRAAVGYSVQSDGMSLRDSIAIAALQGLVAEDASVLYNKGKHCKEAAESCYRMADAMIAAREVKS